uniref:Ribosome biogenesis protein NOP53 n=1 Tax=Strongyloides venezuelensis TaxID=75913 RepID=A0A0K0FTC4_STRVS
MKTNPLPGDPGGGSNPEPFQINNRRKKRKQMGPNESNDGNLSSKIIDDMMTNNDDNNINVGCNSKTYAEMLMVNTDNKNFKKSKRNLANSKFRKLMKEKSITENPRNKPKIKKVKNYFVTEKKDVNRGITFDMGPKERWSRFEKYKGRKLKVFRHEVRK